MKYTTKALFAVIILTSSSLIAVPKPIACWKADGQAEPEAGSEARTTNAVDIGYKQGVSGKAFSFNGETAVIEAALEWKPNTLATTWSVWIRPNESTTQLEILSNDPFAQSLYIRNGKIAIYNAGKNLEFGEVKWGMWQHVAVVFAADHVTVYDRSGPSRQAFPLRGALSQRKLLIGGSTLGMSSAYSGLIDHVSIYDRELSQLEIAELAIRPKDSGRDESTKSDAKTPDNSSKESSAKTSHEWTNTEGKIITAEFVRLDGDVVIVKSGTKEFRIPFSKLAKSSIQQAKMLAEAPAVDTVPAPIPTSPTMLQIKVASKEIRVDRWGTGDKALIFFNHTGPMTESVVANINSYAPLLNNKYSIFLWNYPTARPFSETQRTLQSWMKGEDSNLDFAGVATDVVEGIRTKTGIKEFLLVGNSLGAGLILADYPKLSTDANIRFALVSPTEPFCPVAKKLVPLKNSLLVANSIGDDFVRSAGFKKWIEDLRAAESVIGKIPPGHLILGENLTHEMLARILADFSKAR